MVPLKQMILRKHGEYEKQCGNLMIMRLRVVVQKEDCRTKLQQVLLLLKLGWSKF